MKVDCCSISSGQRLCNIKSVLINFLCPIFQATPCALSLLCTHSSVWAQPCPPPPPSLPSQTSLEWPFWPDTPLPANCINIFYAVVLTLLHTVATASDVVGPAGLLTLASQVNWYRSLVIGNQTLINSTSRWTIPLKCQWSQIVLNTYPTTNYYYLLGWRNLLSLSSTVIIIVTLICTCIQFDNSLQILHYCLICFSSIKVSCSIHIFVLSIYIGNHSS